MSLSYRTGMSDYEARYEKLSLAEDGHPMILVQKKIVPVGLNIQP